VRNAVARVPRSPDPERGRNIPENVEKTEKKQSFLTLFSCRFLVDKALKADIIVGGINIGRPILDARLRFDLGGKMQARQNNWIHTGTIFGEDLRL
jgi:hypothetical protein